jgi:hypothetical protein
MERMENIEVKVVYFVYIVLLYHLQKLQLPDNILRLNKNKKMI